MSVERNIVKILLVEDNLDHIEITKEALQVAGVVNDLFVVRDGSEAIDFLERKGKYQDPNVAFRPGLILLDINLPKKNGLEVLKRLKTNPDLKSIPTILLTVSKREEDVVKGYNYGCNSYIQKPVEFEKFVTVVKQIGLYWGLLNINSSNSSGV
ncbi:response regulator [Candidatus Omnitrophota bacterium]